MLLNITIQYQLLSTSNFDAPPRIIRVARINVPVGSLMLILALGILVLFRSLSLEVKLLNYFFQFLAQVVLTNRDAAPEIWALNLGSFVLGVLECVAEYFRA
jgi:hypothetical protein